MGTEDLHPALTRPALSVPEVATADPAVRTVARLRAVLGLATALMLALSWPLWVANPAFPRVPFVSWAPEVPAPLTWALLASLMVTVVLTAAGFAWRALVGLSLGLLTFLILQDQHRFQPWVYQYGMTMLVLATLPAARGLVYARWWFSAMYLHSGLSKLDASFCAEMGGRFLTVAAGFFGASPAGWPSGWRNAAILAMPAGEIAVALALAVPATRRAGLLGATALHAALLIILGPWGLRHSTIVLAWNVALLAEVWVAFGSPFALCSLEPAPESWLGRCVMGVFWVGAVMPFGERWGIWDAWPSHALYASHLGRAVVYLHRDELDGYPAEVRRHVRSAGSGPWDPVDLTSWSREVRGVPVYPQARACLGLAESLAARSGGRRLIRVVLWGPADPWTGRRSRQELLGLGAIDALGDRSWLNMHPPRPAARSPARAPSPATDPSP